LASVQPSTLFYVLNAGSTGFVIVAGDDNVSPILGYSNEGLIGPANQDVRSFWWGFVNRGFLAVNL